MVKAAILFPGQGAQQVGMAKDLAAAIPECSNVFKRAGDVLGCDLTAICFEGPIEKLTISAHAQPGIFVASMACLAALKLRKPGITFDCAAGLSSGEWTALHLAGVVSFEDTLRILEARGRFMQQACEAQPGGMLTIVGADQKTLETICSRSGIQMANLNSREQTVLSGRLDGIDVAEKVAKELGLRRVIRLNVAGAFHSVLMKPAADKFAAFLQTVNFSAPKMTVVSNVTGKPHGQPDQIRAAMVDQICSSVHWVHSIEWMMEQGIHAYLECGPGKVLTGLVRRIDNQASLTNITDLSTLEAAGAALA